MKVITFLISVNYRNHHVTNLETSLNMVTAMVNFLFIMQHLGGKSVHPDYIE